MQHPTTPIRPPLRLVPEPVAEQLLTAVHHDRGPIWMVELAGEADLSGLKVLEEALSEALSKERQLVVLDVTALEFCDSTCVSAVLDANHAAQVVLTGEHGIVSRVFELLDPDRSIARSV